MATTEVNRLSPLKSIRRKCLDCSGQSAKEVRLCRVFDCTLWPWRFGKRPESVRRRELFDHEFVRLSGDAADDRGLAEDIESEQITAGVARDFSRQPAMMAQESSRPSGTKSRVGTGVRIRAKA